MSIQPSSIILTRFFSSSSSSSTNPSAMSLSSLSLKPRILLISLTRLDINHETSTHLISALQSSVILLQAETVASALAHLASPNLKAVILGDADTAQKKHENLSRQILAFAQMGGTVILGCAFSSFIRPSDFDKYLSDIWGFPWKFGTYQRAEFFVNRLRKNGLEKKTLPNSYSQKAVSLKGVAEEDKVYIPTTESVVESLGRVFGRVDDLDEAPVAFTQIGSGFLGYVGDVNSEEESTDVVLAMLNLA